MRNQAIFGLIVCLCLIGGYIFLDSRHADLFCFLCTLMWPLMIAYTTILLVAAIQHPRKWGCKFYALLLTVLSGFGLLVGAVHLRMQMGSTLSAGDQDICDSSHMLAFKELSFKEQLADILLKPAPCTETFSYFGMNSAQLLTLTAAGLFLFSVYLLFHKVDRDIFR